MHDEELDRRGLLDRLAWCRQWLADNGNRLVFDPKTNAFKLPDLPKTTGAPEVF